MCVYNMYIYIYILQCGEPTIIRRLRIPVRTIVFFFCVSQAIATGVMFANLAIVWGAHLTTLYTPTVDGRNPPFDRW